MQHFIFTQLSVLFISFFFARACQPFRGYKTYFILLYVYVNQTEFSGTVHGSVAAPVEAAAVTIQTSYTPNQRNPDSL